MHDPSITYDGRGNLHASHKTVSLFYVFQISRLETSTGRAKADQTDTIAS